MQQSFLALFCDECGLANDPASTHCAACQCPLTCKIEASETPDIAPVAITRPPNLEVTPGLPFSADYQDTPGEIGPGTILADTYQIQEEIGRGGFAIVYRATEVSHPNHQVAIKRIPLSQLTPGQIIDATETFNREVEVLKKFSDIRGIPEFHEHLTDPENWYLVMQYIPGETLEDLLQKTPGGYLTETRTVTLGATLAQIFNELHTHQPAVIFRDVKPANIMLTPDNKLYLIDFGIARTFKWGKNKDTTPLGSPGYAAPEQYGRAQTNRRADVYGLGATLQTLVTGRDPQELAAGAEQRNPRPPSPELRTLLNEMLDPDQWKRPLDMRNVQIRLESIVPPQIQQDTEQRSSTKSPILTAAGLLTLVLLYMLTSLFSFWLGIFFLLNVGITASAYQKWARKLPFIGQLVVFVSREAVIYLWVLFAILCLVLWLFGLTLPPL